MIEPTADRPQMPPLAERVLGDVLRRQAAAMPQASAVEFPAHGVGFTYEELLDQALRVAGFLQRLGLMPGDRVAIMLANSPQWVLAWYGSLLAGMVDVGINPEASGAILVHQLSVAGVKAVVCGSPSYSAVLDATEKVPGVRAIILVDSETDHSATTSTYGFEELLRGSVASKVEVDPRSIASVRFTSGTTGPAKAVAVTHSQASVFNAHIIWDMEYRPGDRLYTCFALFHNQASINGVAASIRAGGCCIVDDRFSASGYWERIRTSKATLGHILFPLLPMLLAKPLDPTDRDHACRALWTAFFNPEFEARFNTRLLPVYAMTEGNYIAYPPRGLENHPGSCGKVSPLFDIRIVDETDENVAPGDVGEILWRPRASHMMTAGYLGDPSATVATWRDLWFHTGDQGWLDEEGFLFLIGRMGDQIRRRGTNIPASYVEEAALQFPGVVEAAAIAVPAEFGESEVKLCVIVNGEAPSARTFRDHIRKALPREMWPRYVEFRRELPRVDNFKVSKKLLRAEGDHGHTHATIDLSTLSP